MRPVLQLAAAAVVVAAAAVTAYAIQYSYCNPAEARTVLLTHACTTQGVGGAKTSYDLQSGLVAFDEADVYCSAGARIVAPYEGNETVPVYFQLPVRKYTQTRCFANINTQSRKTNETHAAALRSTTQQLVTYLSQAEQAVSSAQARRRPYRPILGNVTLDKVVGVANARVYKDFTTYDGTIVVKYFGSTVVGEEPSRKVRGKVTLKFRGAPRTNP